jgi:hypothetical protein
VADRSLDPLELAVATAERAYRDGLQGRHVHQTQRNGRLIESHSDSPGLEKHFYNARLFQLANP